LPPRGYSEEDIDFVDALGRRIRERREELGIAGPRDLARVIGDERISGDYLSGVERGVNAPRLTALVKIATALKTTSSHLLGDAKGSVANASEERAWAAGYRQCTLDVQEQVVELRRKNS
jgi:transcriptional regulator with XRE-family HTH domain